GQVRVEDGDEGRVVGRQLHRAGRHGLGLVGADGGTQAPQGLGPDLAVAVDLGPADDLPVVGVGVAAAVPGEGALAERGTGLADLAVNRLGAVEVDTLAV